MIYLKVPLVLMASLMVLLLGAPFLIFPTMSMDEGYYITATLKILSGDLFLSNYPFDKGFIHPLSQIPGILFFGKNPLGFKFSGAIFYLGSFVFCVLTFNHILRSHFKRETPLYFLTCLLFALSLYLQPKMIQVGMSTLGEPYLLFFLMATLFQVVRSPNSPLNRWISWTFTAALWTKFSALFWFWILLPSYFTQKLSPLRWLQRFCRLSLPLWILALIYLFTGHFAAIQLLFQDQTSASLSWIDQIGTRLDLMQQSFGGWIALSLALVSALVALIHVLRAPSDRRGNVTIWIFPFWFQFLFLVFITQKFYDRYYLTLIPYFAFFMAHTLGHLFSKESPGRSPWSRVFSSVAPYGMIAISVFFLSRSATATWNHIIAIQPQAQLGRTLFRLIHEFPNDAIIQFDGIEWIMRPYQHLSNAHIVHCTDQVCQEETRVGRPIRNHHYYLDMSDPEANLLRVPFFVGLKNSTFSEERDPSETRCPLPQLHHHTVTRGSRSLLTKLFDRFRITPDFELKSAHWSTFEGSLQKHPPLIPDLGILEVEGSASHWQETSARQHLELNFALRSWPGSSIQIRGVLETSSGPIAKSMMLGGETIVGLRIIQIRIEPLSLELTDLAPNLYGGYFIPIEALNWTQTTQNSLEKLIYDEKSDHYLIEELVSSSDCDI